MPSKRLTELLEEKDALERWAGEGGWFSDPCGSLARIEAKLELQTEPQSVARTHAGRMTRSFVAFEDLTRPEERTFGFYTRKGRRLPPEAGRSGIASDGQADRAKQDSIRRRHSAFLSKRH